MLSSSGGEEITNTSTTNTRRSSSNSLHRVSSSSSSSMSFTSSLSSRTSSSTTSSKTMEEVWKDINLSTLSESTTAAALPSIRLRHHPHSAANFRSTIFQDFLAGPFGGNDVRPSPTMVSTSPMAANLYGAGPEAVSGSPLPHPVTALSLNSGPEFHFLDSPADHPLRPNSHHHLEDNPISNISSFSSPFEGLGSSPVLLPSFGKKRFSTSADCGSGDRRHKRMIKNRESAARSRARKQAYTNELELEVAHLMEENERLRKQQEQYCQAASAQLPKKHTLHRTSTAPF